MKYIISAASFMFEFEPEQVRFGPHLLMWVSLSIKSGSMAMVIMKKRFSPIFGATNILIASLASQWRLIWALHVSWLKSTGNRFGLGLIHWCGCAPPTKSGSMATVVMKKRFSPIFGGMNMMIASLASQWRLLWALQVSWLKSTRNRFGLGLIHPCGCAPHKKWVHGHGEDEKAVLAHFWW